MQEDDHENEGEECATCDEDEGEGEDEERLEDDGEEGEEEGGEEEEREPSEIQRLSWLLSDALHIGYDAHLTDLTRARAKRRETLAFRSAVEDGVGDDRAASTKTLDELEGLGQWMPGDEMQGDVNYRTLQKLLTRVDQRGFERSAQQLEFHQAFMKAAARVIYRENWETEKPVIMKKHGWEKCSSEVLISTPRRFGKTYSIAIFCACLALAQGLEIVVFSPARRASRKLLERIVEFVTLAGGQPKICEYNQEACRLTAFDGKKSLIRSFPSKVGVSCPLRLEPSGTGVGAGCGVWGLLSAGGQRLGGVPYV